MYMILNAYDHEKEILLETGENLYCGHHEFRNERVLEAEAERVELADVKEAMRIINNAKSVRENKGNYIDDGNY